MTIVNILGFLDHMVSAATIQLCHCSIKMISKLKGMAMFQRTLFTKMGGSEIWLMVHGLSSAAPGSGKVMAN